jgi:iron uptake system EfeUOB component EfeO/EfeM
LTNQNWVKTLIMNKIGFSLGAVLAASLFISSCSGVTDQAAQMKEKADQAQNMAKTATGALGNLTNLKDSIGPLTNGASQTLNAVKSGDFATAQTEFTKLQEGWKGLEATLKTTSPDAAKNVGTKIQTIATELKSGKPDAGKLTSELQGLSTDFSGILASAGQAPVGGGANPDAAGTTASTAGAASAGMQGNLTAMKDELAKATTAVEGKDFTGAKQSFTTARQTWYKFGGSVKQKSPETYQKLEDGLKTVNSGLSQAEPVQDTLMTGLKGLTTDLESVQ